MYQDSVGTTAAALESPVGLQLDLSQGLALGSELVSNGTFDTNVTGWTAYSNSAGGTISWLAGTMLVSNPSGTYPRGMTSITTVVGTTYKLTAQVVATSASATIRATTVANGSSGYLAQLVSVGVGTYSLIFVATTTTTYIGMYVESASSNTAQFDNVSVQSLAGNHRTQATSVNRPILSARYNLLTATATLATQSITTVATSYTIYFTGSGSVTLTGTYIGSFTAGTNTFTATAGTLVVTVVGSVLTADIRPTNQTTTLPAYQAVVTSSSYDTTGFPQYIKYNGSSSSLSIASINFTATAQISVFSGMRKLTDTGFGIISELSSNVDFAAGAFLLGVQTSSRYYVQTGVTAARVFGNVTAPSTPVPITNVISTVYDSSLSGTAQIAVRLNGNTATASLTVTGTGAVGNFGTYPLYFGARAGTSVFFNGQEYQTIIVGKTLTAAQITATETYVNSKTQAY